MPLQGPTRRMPRMSHGEILRMHRWCLDNRENPRVIKWLQNHRPRSNWTGTYIQYAYLEMPGEGIIGRLLLWLGA